MKNFSIAVIIVVLFSSSKCNKDDTLINFTLPEKTETGANTFGFLLNSNVWTNYGQVCFITGGYHENLKTIFRNNYFNIYADRVLRKSGGLSTSESIVISLDDRQPITTGNYSLGYNNNLVVI